jgi:cytochrome b-561
MDRSLISLTYYNMEVAYKMEVLLLLPLQLLFWVLSAILVHRWLPGSRGFKKSVHLCLQGLALACGIFGIWTKFHGNDGIVANFFSLHSWMGLICISLFGAQVCSSLLIFLLFFFFFLFLLIWKLNY